MELLLLALKFKLPAAAPAPPGKLLSPGLPLKTPVPLLAYIINPPYPVKLGKPALITLTVSPPTKISILSAVIKKL